MCDKSHGLLGNKLGNNRPYYRIKLKPDKPREQGNDKDKSCGECKLEFRIYKIFESFFYLMFTFLSPVTVWKLFRHSQPDKHLEFRGDGCNEFLSIPICLQIAEIVPAFKSFWPQSGIVVPFPVAGLNHFRCDPPPRRSISRHPNARSFLVNSL